MIIASNGQWKILNLHARVSLDIEHFNNIFNFNMYCNFFKHEYFKIVTILQLMAFFIKTQI
jgi:hypothetical protein